MDFFTHIVVGVAGGRFLFRNPDHQKAFILGSISPDFDAFIAWLPALIPDLIVLGHRGVSHSLIFMLFAIPILIHGTRYLKTIKRFPSLEALLRESQIPLTGSTWIIGASGSFFHLIIDTLNPQGTMLFYPFLTERVSVSTMSFIDPVVTLLSGGFFFWFLYKKVYKEQVPSIKVIDRYTRTVTVLFVVMLSSYALMQINTVNNYQPETSTTEVLSFQRWIIEDITDSLKVELVNQLTQQVERTYFYEKITWNQSRWSRSDIESVITAAMQTRKYRNFIFKRNPDTRLVYNVTMNFEENSWAVEITDVFEDVLLKYWGLDRLLPTRSKFEVTIEIY
ncbi:MAG: metal-dependent hydrolase [Candidatus Odinarchaeota archaeon]